MPIRITTWNVNGIRNPFKYTPWNKDRTLQAMFDLLEADIACFQEVKMPKASMTDDLVFVDGWESFYSFPHSQTGYSGVAVFTRDSTCRPLRVEEGVTGRLRVPGTPTRYVDAPAADQIGGYPTAAQLRRAAVAPDALDAEGRCLVLEFPLFVLLNVYCPARRNDERTGFRHAFLRALDARVRNLAAAGKNVVLVGDLNIARDQLDWPGVWSAAGGPDGAGTPRPAEALAFDAGPMRAWATQLLNRLLFHSRRVDATGAPFSRRRRRAGSDDASDSPLPPPILHDTTRERHPRRVGMFTCWDTRKNHRPANYGSRIDYVLCSPPLLPLVADANIQPRLLGSDHCPVYVVLRDTLDTGAGASADTSTSTDTGTDAGTDAAGSSRRPLLHTVDYLNPPGRFVQGRPALPPDQDAALLRTRVPQSARRLPQFANRRHVFHMFRQAAAATAAAAAAAGAAEAGPAEAGPAAAAADGCPDAEQGMKSPAAAAESAPPQLQLPAVLRADPVAFVAFSDDDDDEYDEDDGDEDFGAADGDGDAGPSQSADSTPAVPDRAAFFGAGQRSDRSASASRGNTTTTGAATPAGLHSQVGTGAADGDALPAGRADDGGSAGTGAATTPDRPRPEGSTAAPTQTRPSPARTFFRTASASLPSSLPPAASAERHLVRSRSASGAGTAAAGAAAPPPRPAKKAKTNKTTKTAKTATTAKPSTGTQTSMSRFLLPGSAARKPAQPAAGAPPPPAEPEPSAGPAAAAAQTPGPADNDDDDNDDDDGFDAVELVRSREDALASWSRLGLGQRQAPLCEHGEPCKTFVTRKAGVNSGRSFYMCARPPGPLGRREKGTPWQCTTFVWCRDWRPADAAADAAADQPGAGAGPASP